MKAVFYKGKGTFEIGEGKIVAPGKGEARLEVAYCGVCGTDVHIFHGTMDARVAPPQIIGHEASAIVAEIGEGVTNVKVGDKVVVRPLHFGAPHSYDNGHPHIGKNLKFIGIDSQGAFQNSWTVPAYTLHHLPENLSLKYGALIEPLAVACHDVRRGRVKAGENAVVIGGGPIGLLIAFVLRSKGANVIVSEVNENRLKSLKELGFATINPVKEDIVARVSELTNETMAHVVFEVSGSQAGVDAITKIGNARGRIVMVAIHGGEPKKIDLFKFFWAELELIGARLYEADDFDEAIALAASGKIPMEAMITRVDDMANIQDVFKTIDNNPEGMKYLINCQS